MSITKRISFHGRRAFLSDEDMLTGLKGVASGGEGIPAVVYPSHAQVAVFDDFTGDLLADEWAQVEGDTGHTQAIQTGTNGVYRQTVSITATPAHTANTALTANAHKQWKANQGPGGTYGSLRLAARVKMNTVARTAGDRFHAFVGFSDSGGAEMPAYDTGAGVISNASDLVGFLFSAGGDTGWSLIAAKSVAGDSGDQLVVPGVGPTANVYENLEVEVRRGQGDANGTAYFYRNGVLLDKITYPVNTTVALSPWIGGFIQDTGDTVTNFLDIDYVAISAPRDTGL